MDIALPDFSLKKNWFENLLSVEQNENEWSKARHPNNR
jgi:hypothetical protein